MQKRRKKTWWVLRHPPPNCWKSLEGWKGLKGDGYSDCWMHGKKLQSLWSRKPGESHRPFIHENTTFESVYCNILQYNAYSILRTIQNTKPASNRDLFASSCYSSRWSKSLRQKPFLKSLGVSWSLLTLHLNFQLFSSCSHGSYPPACRSYAVIAGIACHGPVVCRSQLISVVETHFWFNSDSQHHSQLLSYW